MLKNREELQQLRTVCQKAFEAEKKKILVCTGTGCVSSGSLDVYAELVRLMKDAGIACSVELQKDPHGDEIRVTISHRGHVDHFTLNKPEMRFQRENGARYIF